MTNKPAGSRCGTILGVMSLLTAALGLSIDTPAQAADGSSSGKTHGSGATSGQAKGDFLKVDQAKTSTHSGQVKGKSVKGDFLKVDQAKTSTQSGQVKGKSVKGDQLKGTQMKADQSKGG